MFVIRLNSMTMINYFVDWDFCVGILTNGFEIKSLTIKIFLY